MGEAVGDHHVVDEEVGAVDQRPGAADFATDLGDRRNGAMRVANGLEGIAGVDGQVDLVDSGEFGVEGDGDLGCIALSDDHPLRRRNHRIGRHNAVHIKRANAHARHRQVLRRVAVDGDRSKVEVSDNKSASGNEPSALTKSVSTPKALPVAINSIPKSLTDMGENVMVKSVLPSAGMNRVSELNVKGSETLLNCTVWATAKSLLNVTDITLVLSMVVGGNDNDSTEYESWAAPAKGRSRNSNENPPILSMAEV